MVLSCQSESRHRTRNTGNTARGWHNCKQASMFRQTNQNLRVTDLIDEHSNQSCEVQEGRMNIISHMSILHALEHHASQYRCKGKLSSANNNLVSWALDKTGTVDLFLLLNGTEVNEQVVLVGLQEKSRVEKLGILDEVLKVHGVAPASKGGGIIHLIYKNANGFSNRLSDNEKVEKAKEVHDELNVDIAAYCKYWLNMRNRHNVNSFNQLFKGEKTSIQSVVAHDTHKNIGCMQKGGTSLLLFGALTEQLVHDEPGKDKTGLGCWLVMTLKGDGVQTRVVCGYNPCYNKKSE
jgi:hypothetical protein